MRNEKLITFMEARGISKTQLSALSGIPMSTLTRIIEGTVQKVKFKYMEEIAKALDTPVQSVFEVPAEISLLNVISPDEIGTSVTKQLNQNETLLLYWFQNTYKDGQAAILTFAKSQHAQTQNSITKKYNPAVDDHSVRETVFEQLSLQLAEG